MLFQAIMIRQKHGDQGWGWGGGGGVGGWAGLTFPIYLIENFKTLFVRNHCNDFNITQQKYIFGDPLSRLFKPS